MERPEAKCIRGECASRRLRYQARSSSLEDAVR